MYHSTKPPLAEAAIPGLGIRRDVLMVLGGTMLVALASQISIPLPFSPVPVTGQTLAVLLAGATLGSKRGTLAMLAYIAVGMMYLPVFAGGVGGPARLAGPTGGYLLGFVVAAWTVGRLCERGWDRKLWTALAAMTTGTAIIFACGLPWLSVFVGSENVLLMGFYPFVPGALLKITLAAAVLPVGWKILANRKK